MAVFEDKIQALMDEVYNEWQKEENKGKGKWDILGGFSEAHQIAVVLGNFNYQVGNGGLEQWIYNGYFHDDAEKLIEYLEIGAESDDRCGTILDRIYKLDQYANETDCDRYGYYYDEDGDSNSIGEMIDCDTFDTWYYAKCDGENWWQVVCGIIDKVEGRESVPVSQDEHDGKITDVAYQYTIRAFIENADKPELGGFTMPFPSSAETMRPFLEGIEVSGRGGRSVTISDIQSPIPGLGKHLSTVIKPDNLDELNYLAVRLERLDETGREIFAAAMEAGKHCGSMKDMINLTFEENINWFDLFPVYNAEQYGDLLVNQFHQDEHAEAFNRLNESEDPADRAFAAHIERLEAHIDYEAYGRDAANEEHGVFTERGYLLGSEEFTEYYRGPEYVPQDYRVTSPELLMKVKNVDLGALVYKMHALFGDYMSDAHYDMNTIADGSSRYLMLMSERNMFITEISFPYQRGTTPNEVCAAQPSETQAFTIDVMRRENGHIWGSLTEVNFRELQNDIRANGIEFTHVEATLKDGTERSYTREEWNTMELIDRDRVKSWTLEYSDDDLGALNIHIEEMREQRETSAHSISPAKFITELNRTYMERAENPQPDMLRVTLPAAKELLARGDCAVYRLLPGKAEPLTPMEAVKTGLQYQNYREFAVKREDISGVDKWSERGADDLLSRRAERDKPKNKDAEH